ncbi:MAG: tRNA (adenosine(37)-N6)-threonylcarbamoyltransferase complex transferase subunit TsaD [Bacteroidales bacterium]
MQITILGIESSCDDTAAAIVQDGVILSTLIANQDVHKSFGGVVPELASRAHQQNIVPVIDQAMKAAGVRANEISAVAFTRGPGLMGSLLVGTSFAKGFAVALSRPLIEVNHLQAHILAHFIRERDKEFLPPGFPFICLLVSGGHTQLLVIRDYLDMSIIGRTIDDAAGEAFDKCAKILALPYPGGPLIDKYGALGNPQAFTFSKPRVAGLDFSFSGLKTSFLYFLQDQLRKDPGFTEKYRDDLCASIQQAILDILFDKLLKAVKETGIRRIAIAGGVSANSALRKRLVAEGEKNAWEVYIPAMKYSTDNAAMIAITGYFKYLKGQFTDHSVSPLARMDI